MLVYKTLENTETEILHEAFVNAFSDYQVKIDLPFWKFQHMIQRRGFTPEVSMGAFEDGELIGFILNGFRNWNGKPTLYDVGTGVIPEYRRKGITSCIFGKVRELAKEKKVGQYLLEVLQSNTSAVNLYTNQGFKVTRSFQCFKIDRSKYNRQVNYEVQHIDRIDSSHWEKFKTFWDIIPSWQNSIDSIDAACDDFVYSIVRIDNEVVGYGIIDRRTGDIPQIAVDKNHRMKGIGGRIVSDLISNAESQGAGVLNIDDEAKEIKDALLKLGFTDYVSQYEMVLEL